ncbi:hypothetical protein WN48_06422 [Eufriesea mexicana]|uniref:Uncharacterized protein n=1 Tax=Eufriesea mexicana TaxID=516756 RepID=A0A310SCM8_9HYME|nr:hypothetical protein WN48_06422 [Eufriesea mexicana]
MKSKKDLFSRPTAVTSSKKQLSQKKVPRAWKIEMMFRRYQVQHRQDVEQWT